jgi:16S rRNA (uracil1498-N3)-methyltransferase
MVEKCAEIGARRVTPLTTERSSRVGGGGDNNSNSTSGHGNNGKKKRGNAKSRREDEDEDEDGEAGTSGREGRWGRVALAASKQSLRVNALIVTAPVDVHEMCETMARENGTRLTLLAAAGAPPIAEVMRGASAEEARCGRILIGPEGDFTDGEIKALVAAGARVVGLGPLRLRVETAAVAALAAVSALVEGRK